MSLHFYAGQGIPHMSWVNGFYVANDYSSAAESPSNITQGPQNTIILTTPSSVEIYADLPKPAQKLAPPAATFSALATPKTKPGHSQVSLPFKTFTHNTMYHKASNTLIAITDGHKLTSWSTAAGSTLFTSHTYTMFNETVVDAYPQSIYTMLTTDDLRNDVIVIDCMGNQLILPVPSMYAKRTHQNANQVIGVKHLSTPWVSKATKTSARHITPPKILQASILTGQRTCVVTSNEIIVYSHQDAVSKELFRFLYLNPPSASVVEASSQKRPSSQKRAAATAVTPATPAPSVLSASIHSRSKDSFVFTYLLSTGLITTGVVNIPHQSMTPLMSQQLSRSYLNFGTTLSLLTEAHLLVITPSLPSALEKTTEIILMDTRYYSILSHVTSDVTYNPYNFLQLTQISPGTKKGPGIYALLTTDAMLSLFVQLETPHLSSSIGCATRDAKFWEQTAALPLASAADSKTSGTAESDSTHEPTTSRKRKAAPKADLEDDLIAHAPSKPFPFILTQPSTAPLSPVVVLYEVFRLFATINVTSSPKLDQFLETRPETSEIALITQVLKQPTSSTQLYTLIHYPTAWCGLLSQSIKSTQAQFPSPIIDYVNQYNVKGIHPAYSWIQPQLPVAPQHVHVIFQYCIQQLEASCRHYSCVNTLFLLPIYLLLANNLLDSNLTSAAVRYAFKAKNWTLIATLINVTPFAYSDLIIDILVASLQSLQDLDLPPATELPQKSPKTPPYLFPPRKRRPGYGRGCTCHSKNAPLPVDFPHEHLNPYQRKAQTSSKSKKKSTAGIISAGASPSSNTPLPLLNADVSFAPRDYLDADFVHAVVPHISPVCLLYTLLGAPVTPLVVSHQLRYIPQSTLTVLLNILAMLLQTTMVPTVTLPHPWASPMSANLTIDAIIQWISMVIDAQFSGITLAACQQDEHVAQSIAIIDKLLHQHSTSHLETQNTVLGLLTQLKRIPTSSKTDKHIVPSYSVMVLKF